MIRAPTTRMGLLEVRARRGVAAKGARLLRAKREVLAGRSRLDEVLREAVKALGIARAVIGEETLVSLADGAGRESPLEVKLRKVWIEEQLKLGLVDWPAVQDRLREQGVVLVGGGADEAPEVYKRLPDVLAAHGATIRVKHTLRPLGVAMAGRDVVDPYKD